MLAGSIDPSKLNAITASKVSDFDTEVANNATVTLNTTHRTSNGSDHSYIDQDVTSGSSPTFTGTNISGLATAGRAAIITASDITPEVDVYEIHSPQSGGNYLRLMEHKDFPITRSAAQADSEYGWTWANRGALDSADENTTTSNGRYLDHDNTNTDMVDTHPFFYKTFYRTYKTQTFIARISGTGNGSIDTSFLKIRNADSSTYVLGGPSYNSAPRIRFNNGGVSTWEVITADQRANGVWIKLVQDSDGDVLCFYNTDNTSVVPTTWTHSVTYSGQFGVGVDSLRVGGGVCTANTSDTATGSFLHMQVDDEIYNGFGSLQPLWHATQFNTDNTAQEIITDYDLGADAPTVDETRLQLILADLENTLPGDASTNTYSVVQSATPGASAGAYAAAGSITVGGSGRYLNIWVKMSSSGDDGGSLQLPLVIPVQ